MFPFSFSRVFHSLAVSQDQHTQNPWTSFLLPRCQNRAPLWRTSVALDPGSAAKMVRWDDNNTTTVKQVNLFWAQAREKIQNGEEGGCGRMRCMKYCTWNLQNMSHSVRILRSVSVYKTAPPTAPFAFFPPWSPLRPPEVSLMLSSFSEFSECNQVSSSVILAQSSHIRSSFITCH